MILSNTVIGFFFILKSTQIIVEWSETTKNVYKCLVLDQILRCSRVKIKIPYQFFFPMFEVYKCQTSLLAGTPRGGGGGVLRSIRKTIFIEICVYQCTLDVVWLP